MRDMYNVSLLDILPPSIASDNTVIAAAKTLDAELLKITNEIKKLPLLFVVDDLAEPWLDELAWQLHVDFYDVSFPIEQKRELIKKSDAWHRRKGTPSAVEELTTSIFGDGLVEEWFDYGGLPYHFRVSTTNSEATTAKAYDFLRAINSVKRLTAVLDSVSISSSVSMPLYFGFAIHTGETMTLRQVV